MQGGVVMNVKELYNIVTEYFGYKIGMSYYNSETKEVKGTLYESFFLVCFIDNSTNKFRAEIRYGDSNYAIREFLRRKCVGKLERKSVQECLKIIDDYCRLRLPDKFLEAHYKAYVLSLYEDYDM